MVWPPAWGEGGALGEVGQQGLPGLHSLGGCDNRREVRLGLPDKAGRI